MFIISGRFLHCAKKGLLTIIIVAALLFLNSCKKSSLVPAYIHIDHIALNSTYEIDGTNSSKITDAWVYVDDNLIGIYELPATFPVLASGSHKITVKAGIKINGIAKSRGYYPFFQTYSTNINLQSELIDTIQPEVTYYPNKIKWKEDFEDAGVSIIRFTGSDTSFYKTTLLSDAFEGSYSALAELDATHPTVICVSDSSFEIPQNQSPVYLELNYKTNVYLSIGMIGKLASGTSDPIETIILNPTDEWNKIYIDLTSTVNYTVNTLGFKIFFKAEKLSDVANPKIFIDNIKLLYTN